MIGFLKTNQIQSNYTRKQIVKLLAKKTLKIHILPIFFVEQLILEMSKEDNTL